MHDPIEPRIPRDVLVSSPVSPMTDHRTTTGDPAELPGERALREGNCRADAESWRTVLPYALAVLEVSEEDDEGRRLADGDLLRVVLREAAREDA